MKRIALFLLTNLAVLVTLSVVAHLFGLKHFIGAQGLDFGALLAFAALFGFGYYVTFIVLEIALGILASGIVMWFSRRREFRADTGGADLAGRTGMIAALERLQSMPRAPQLPERVAAFGISGGGKSAWTRFFSTHPPLEDRILALRGAATYRAASVPSQLN